MRAPGSIAAVLAGVVAINAFVAARSVAAPPFPSRGAVAAAARIVQADARVRAWLALGAGRLCQARQVAQRALLAQLKASHSPCDLR